MATDVTTIDQENRDRWWAFVLRGVAAILFGVLTFVMPKMALLTLIFLFGVYALVEGVFNVASAARRSSGVVDENTPRWLLLLQGLVSIAAGIVAFVVPGITAVALLYLIGAWAVVHGVLAIAAEIRLRKQVEGDWLLALNGVLSIIFGILVFAFPGAGALGMLWWIGIYAIIAGVLLVSLGIKLRNWTKTHGDDRGYGFHRPAEGH